MSEGIATLLVWCAFAAGMLIGMGVLMVFQMNCKDCKKEGTVRCFIGLVLAIVACVLA